MTHRPGRGEVGSVLPVSKELTAEQRSWRELAVARTSDPARERAEERVRKILDAAFELLRDSEGKDFTLQMVVERSGQSLRSFYQHFAGKHELLLAVFEETVRSTADALTRELEEIDDALERLRTFIMGYYRICRSGQSQGRDALPSRTLGQFAHQLLFDHPHEAAEAFTPLVDTLQQLLEDADVAHAIGPGLDHRQAAGLILQSIMFNSFATTITGAKTDDLPDRADLVWRLLFHGLGGGGAGS